LVSGDNAFALRTIYKWYHLFEEGRTDFGDSLRSGRALSDDLM
jgi:hypothetical protein